MMRTRFRLASIASAAVAAAVLAGCADQPMTRTTVSSYPQPVYSQPAPVYSAPPPAPVYSQPAPAYVEYGRVSNIEVLTTEQKAQSSTGGLIIGAIAGGILGNAVGRGSSHTGRDLATVGGAIAGGAVGNHVGRNTSPGTVTQQFRVSIQVDNGPVRYYNVDTASNLRIGDRVRIENGQIFRV